MPRARSVFGSPLLATAAVVVAAVALAPVARVAATSIVVPAAETVCFYEEAKETGKVLHGSYDVAAGGFLDIDVEVKSPTGEVRYAAKRKTSDTFHFSVKEAGLHEVCFSNAMSTVTSKTVSFNIRIGAGLGASNDELATSNNVKPLETRVMELAQQLVRIKEVQNYANVRERQHRDTTESTNDRVKWFSIAEFVILILTNVWQIHSLRQFFETRRRI